MLNNNSLSHFQIRPLPSLTELRTLHMRCTQRALSNIPSNLEALIHLSDVDLSENQLTKVPEGLLSLTSLKVRAFSTHTMHAVVNYCTLSIHGLSQFLWELNSVS